MGVITSQTTLAGTLAVKREGAYFQRGRISGTLRYYAHLCSVMSWDLACDPRAKPGVINRIWQTMAACGCNAISKYKLNLPLHVSMYQFLEL